MAIDVSLPFVQYTPRLYIEIPATYKKRNLHSRLFARLALAQMLITACSDELHGLSHHSGALSTVQACGMYPIGFAKKKRKKKEKENNVNLEQKQGL